jgi:hypothetical protein
VLLTASADWVRRVKVRILVPPCSRSCGEAEVLDFQFGLFSQPTLVSIDARLRAETHLIVATCGPAERVTAMVATDCHERRIPELASWTQLSKLVSVVHR